MRCASRTKNNWLSMDARRWSPASPCESCRNTRSRSNVAELHRRACRSQRQMLTGRSRAVTAHRHSELRVSAASQLHGALDDELGEVGDRSLTCISGSTPVNPRPHAKQGRAGTAAGLHLLLGSSARAVPSWIRARARSRTGRRCDSSRSSISSSSSSGCAHLRREEIAVTAQLHRRARAAPFSRSSEVRRALAGRLDDARIRRSTAPGRCCAPRPRAAPAAGLQALAPGSSSLRTGRGAQLQQQARDFRAVAESGARQCLHQRRGFR